MLPGYDGGYDVTPDGERFFVRMQNPEARVHEIHVVRKWFEVLKERAGASQR